MSLLRQDTQRVRTGGVRNRNVVITSVVRHDFSFLRTFINMLNIGDLILQNNERGVVCCLDPPIMRTIDFHSYVPILHEITVVQSAYDAHATIKPAIAERIRVYVNEKRKFECDTPTGAD